MKSVFVTGYGSGIGFATYKLLTEKGYKVYGGCRATGYDISGALGDNIGPILEHDVLVNNAYHPIWQTKLLQEVYSHWKGLPKTIINVGSAHTGLTLNRPFHTLEYTVAKSALQVYSFWISENDHICRSMMYQPGVVDTPLSRKGMEGWSKEDLDKRERMLMPAEESAKMIEYMISSSRTLKQVIHV